MDKDLSSLMQFWNSSCAEQEIRLDGFPEFIQTYAILWIGCCKPLSSREILDECVGGITKKEPVPIHLAFPWIPRWSSLHLRKASVSTDLTIKTKKYYPLLVLAQLSLLSNCLLTILCLTCSFLGAIIEELKEFKRLKNFIHNRISVIFR